MDHTQHFIDILLIWMIENTELLILFLDHDGT